VADKLVAKGLAHRHTDETDRRAVVIQLSAEGEKLTGRIWEMGRFKLTDLLEKLSEDELKRAAGLTDALLARLERPSP
jgi:DNA-binding MarR family transcriptional regulator